MYKYTHIHIYIYQYLTLLIGICFVFLVVVVLIGLDYSLLSSWGFCLEFREFLGSRSTSRNFQNIESDSFRNWSTLTNGDNITFFNSESWRDVSSNILVSFFVSVIFWNVMQVISSDNDGTVHFGGNNSTGQDFTSDGNSTSEWTFFVNVRTFNGSFWGFET